jgi:hypothetical protein
MNMSIDENNMIRFTGISKSKTGLFAKFRAKVIKGEATYTFTISVDIYQANVDATDSLEKIIKECGRIAAARLSQAELQFEGITQV